MGVYKPACGEADLAAAGFCSSPETVKEEPNPLTSPRYQAACPRRFPRVDGSAVYGAAARLGFTEHTTGTSPFDTKAQAEPLRRSAQKTAISEASRGHRPAGGKGPGLSIAGALSLSGARQCKCLVHGRGGVLGGGFGRAVL